MPFQSETIDTSEFLAFGGVYLKSTHQSLFKMPACDVSCCTKEIVITIRNYDFIIKILFALHNALFCFLEFHMVNCCPDMTLMFLEIFCPSIKVIECFI